MSKLRDELKLHDDKSSDAVKKLIKTFDEEFIDSIKKYESIDVSHHHSIIIPIYLLQVLGYVDFVFKSTDLKHPKRRNETDES